MLPVGYSCCDCHSGQEKGTGQGERAQRAYKKRSKDRNEGEVKSKEGCPQCPGAELLELGKEDEVELGLGEGS